MVNRVVEAVVLLIGILVTVAFLIFIPLHSYNEYKDYLAQIEEQNQANQQASIKPKLESITVSLKEGVRYFANDLANAKAEHFIVTANYVKGEEQYSEAVEEGQFTVNTPADFYVRGGEVKITYKGVSATVSVTLEPVVLEAIEISVNPYTINYQAGSTFDPAGMKVVAIYNDNSSKVLSGDQYVVDTTKILTVGDKAATISFTDGETTKTVDLAIGVFETLNNGAVQSIVIVDNAIVNVGSTASSASMEVNAIYENGNRRPLSADEYTINASSDIVEFGKKYSLTVSYNEDTTKTATTDIVVRQTIQGEHGTIVGGVANSEPEYAVINGVITPLGNNVDFGGGFDNSVHTGEDAYITFNLYSSAATVGNITMRCGNSYCVSVDGGYMMKPLQINTILDLTINGREVQIPASVVLKGCGPAEKYAPLFGIYYEFTIEGVQLDPGFNEVKLTFKKSTVGATNTWGKSPSTLNIDYVNFDSLGSEIPDEYVIENIEIAPTFKPEYAQRFDEIDVPVIATISTGSKITIDKNLYTVEVIGGNQGDSVFGFGKYSVKVTLISDPSVSYTAEYEIKAYKSFAVLNAGVEIIGGRVYYVFSGESVGYTAEDIEFFDEDVVYDTIIEFGYETFTMKIDVTDLKVGTVIYPHLRLEDMNYENGANANGDIRDNGLQFTDGQSVTHNSKKYTITTEYYMPTLVVSDYSRVAEITAADIVAEGNNVYYIFTYTVAGCDPATFEFFDGETVFAVEESIIDGDTVTFKINVTDYNNITFYPHLRIDGANWDGNKGDVKIAVSEKTVDNNGKIYTLESQYSMPVLVIASATRYNAEKDNSFTSDKALLKDYVWGSEGLETNGKDKSSEYIGGIGNVDQIGSYVTYTFTLTESGKVDIIWNVAGSKWNGTTKTNDGLADMAAHMSITLDDKMVVVSGIALPAGEDSAVWWNLQQIVLKDVELEAGTHTFHCLISTKDAGLNVGSMEIYFGTSSNPDHVHSLTKIDAVDPTCTTEGTEAYYVCSCGKLFSDEEGNVEISEPQSIAKIDHSYTVENVSDDTIKSEADCTNAAIYYKSCACGAVSNSETFVYGTANGHTEVIDPAVESTCTSTGLTEGKHCSVCNVVLVPQTVSAVKGHVDKNNDFKCDNCSSPLCVDHIPSASIKENEKPATCTENGSYDVVVKCTNCGYEISRENVSVEALGHKEEILPAKAATCTESGLTEGKKCTVCGVTTIAQQIVEPSGHSFTTVLEDEDGFYQVCDECGESKDVSAPVADSYTAVLDNSFASAKEKLVNLIYGKYGAWGVTTNGAYKSETGAPAGAIGGLDSAGKYVYYEFTIDKDGTVDIVWNIAGSNWDGKTNAGIKDMAAHMTVTIDGKPVNISGIELPAGTGDQTWWNMQNIIIKGVALEAGTHVLRCDITAAGGLNVGSLTVHSDKNVDARRAEATKADIVEIDGKLYYTLSVLLNGYTTEDVNFWSSSSGEGIPFTTSLGANGETIILVDISDYTDGQRLNPHLSFAGKNYVNNANTNGDVRGDSLAFEEKFVEYSGKLYKLFTNYSMPAVDVIESACVLNSADIILENNTVYYILNYTVVGYDPAKFEFFDGETVYNIEKCDVNGSSVSFKFKVSANIYPHLRIDGSNWDGDKGDVLLTVEEKSVELYGNVYTLLTKWDMPVVTITTKTTTLSHICENKCMTCGKCLVADCSDDACADKCEGHSGDSDNSGFVKEVLSLNLMSFNIRTLASESNPINNWDNRKAAVVSFLNNCGADIIGLQEVRESQYFYISTNISSNYTVLYFPREATSDPEGLAFIYDHTKFDFVSAEQYWLSETPETQSYGWGESYYRIAAVLLLRHSETGELVKSINTHGPLNDEANVKAYELIMDRSVNECDPFVFLCGDFNVAPSVGGYDPVADELQDGRVVAESSSSRDHITYQGWGTYVDGEQPDHIIDFCFVSKGSNVVVKSYDVITDRWGDGNMLSDHYPVRIIVELGYYGSIENHKHNPKLVAKVEPTCSDAGTEAYYKCSCGKLYSDAEGTNEIDAPVSIDALDHSFSDYISNEDATCEADGTKTAKCDRCDATDTVADIGSALGHSFTNYISNRDATCEEDGTKTAKCDRCDATDVVADVDSKLGHNYGADWTSDENGHWHVCANGCGIKGAEEAHTPNIDAATENDPKICTVCNYVIEQALGHTTHAYNVPQYDDTHHWNKCYGCDLIDEKIVHSYNETILSDATCTTTGSKQLNCDCGHSKNEIIAEKGHTEVIDEAISATCTNSGLTEGKHCSVCNEVIKAQTVVDALGHIFSEEAVKGDDGNYYFVCTGNCGETKFSHYGATINNDFASDKSNSLNIVYDDFGAWGVETNGNHEINIKEGSPASGAIGGLDKIGTYVYYEFVMDEAGVVDFIWNIAGSNWNSSTNSNDGLTDMAAHMTVTIDGIPVDISGIALSYEGQYQWWNLQNLIIDNVSLDAGVHTFKCDVTAAGGLNVASMTINATSDVYVRSADVTNASISLEGDKVYYVLTFVNNGFEKEEIKFWHNSSTSYDIAYFETVNGVTTVKIDVTDLGLATQINPHLSFAGKNYVNGANANGDVRDGSLDYDLQAVTANGKSYVIFAHYSMPALLVCENYMKLQSVDIIEEDGTVYYAITCHMAGYDTDAIQIFDGDTVYDIAKIDNKSGVYTFKIDATKYSSIWPHLKVNGAKWDGANNKSSTDGNVILTVDAKSIKHGDINYVLRTQYSMPALGTSADKVTPLGADLYEEDGSVYYTLTLEVIGYDTSKFEFFHNNLVLGVTEIEQNGISYTFKMKLEDFSGNFYPHLRIDGQNWTGVNANGDIQLSVKEKLVAYGDKYILLTTDYSMPIIKVVDNYLKITGADLVSENDKLYYVLTYTMAGYDPSGIEFFDSSTYEVAEVEQNGFSYSFKIDVEKYSSIYPHLKVNGNKWDSVNNKSSGNGDVIFSVNTKSVTFNGKVYTLQTKWNMPVLTSASA